MVVEKKTMATVAPDLEEVKRIVLSGLRGYRVRVYLFGSWAQNRQGRTSDIDVGVLPLEPLPVGILSEIREALEESRVLYPVDLVDLSRSDPDFLAHVEREGISWTA
jgi:predicted nucleotidyltransferase